MNTARARETKTGGRAATTRHIPPIRGLAVGMPDTPAPAGWTWSALTDIARMESGHTPSRRHPEYWGGDVPWISISDARDHHGMVIHQTEEQTNSLGLANSSARLLPAETVCLSRTASVGYVTVTGCPMATSQDFVNWICSENLLPRFLQYLLLAEGEDLLRFASGSVHQTIYFPEAKAFHICYPPAAEQRRIVAILDEAIEGIDSARAYAEKNLRNATALFEAALAESFQDEDGASTSLEDVCDIASTLVDPRAKPYHNMLHVGGANMVSGTGDLVDLTTAKDEGLISGKFAFREGVVLYSKIRPYLRKVARPHFSGLCSADVYPLTPKTGRIARDYLYHLLLSPRFTEYAVAGSARAGMPKVNRPYLFAFRFPLPTLNTQRRITARLDAIAESSRLATDVAIRKLATLDELKTSLLHHAFTGNL